MNVIALSASAGRCFARLERRASDAAEPSVPAAIHATVPSLAAILVNGVRGAVRRAARRARAGDGRSATAISWKHRIR
jgi:hypothetical protein